MKNKKTITALALRGAVLLPGGIGHFDIKREKSVIAVDKAMGEDEKIFLVTQIENDVEEPKQDDLYEYGTIASIKQMVRSKDGTIRIMVEGLRRARLLVLDEQEKYLVAEVEEDEENLFLEEDSSILPAAKTAMVLVIKDLLQEHMNFLPEHVQRNMAKLLEIDELERLIHRISAEIIYDNETKYALLLHPSVEERYQIIIKKLISENQILQIKKEFNKQIKENIDKNQKEYVLREQLKVIQEELGDNSHLSESKEYKRKLKSLEMEKEDKDKIKKEIDRLSTIQQGSPEANVIRNYLDTIFDLPWNIYSEDIEDIKTAAKILDKNHYGLDKVKERIIEYLAVRILNPNGNAPILCLVGPPGTGKTSIAKSVAEAIGKKYVRISLGGVRDEAEIRGHRKTYIGAMPGRLVEGLRSAKVSNPLMLLDEIDKVSSDYKGDTSSALLEVLDGEQNVKFRDHYVEIPIDLSKVLFIATANSVSTIPRPLLDRMELIEIHSYTENEKFHIAKEHLLAKQIKENGLSSKQISIQDDAIRKIIHHYTKEAGVRNLERKIGEVCRKAARKVLEGRKTKLVITERNLAQYLGKEKIHYEKAAQEDEIGIVRGLAWTSLGGDTLSIEVNIVKGKGNLKLTGQMGDVMKESANIAFSAIRALAKDYGLKDSDFEEQDFHLHIPEGAVPKDGPSAGITMATAFFSVVSGRKVRADVAMTGEITLRGRVLPIGGLKEKILAAKMADIKTVLVPKKNTSDIEELSEEIVSGLEIRFVSDIQEVLDYAIAK